MVIAADGVESKFSRWCGVDTAVPLRELMSCAQYILTDIEIDPAMTVFYLGNAVAPEGYAWVFPKGRRTANVGIGISSRRSRKGNRARDYLDRFVAEHFPDGKTIEYIVGGVSVCRPLSSTVSDGLMIVGDAARVSDPITGGGIYNAMHTGRLAAGVASEAVSAGDCSEKALMPYDHAWRHSKFGKNLERNYRIKEVLHHPLRCETERDRPFHVKDELKRILGLCPSEGAPQEEPPAPPRAEGASRLPQRP